MPIVFELDGIRIEMRYNEHNPPHFHARYGEFEAAFDLNGKRIEGKFPKPQGKLLAAWAEIHKADLQEKWDLAKIHKGPMRIK